MKRLIASSIVLASALAAPAALAHKGHSHGVSTMDVAAEGANLKVDLEIPLGDLVGFEREAKDDKERATLEAAKATLARPDAIVAAAPEAKCKVSKVSVDMGKPSAGHADAKARYELACESAPRSVDVMLFDAFKRVKRVDARAVTAKGQSSAKLTSGKRRLTL